MQSLICVFLLLAVVPVFSRERVAPLSAQVESPSADQPSSALSEGAAENLLSQLSEGIVGQDRAKILGLFDRERMPDYSDFAEQIGLMLDRYDSFRVRYRFLQLADEAAAHAAIVDFTLEAIPASENQLPVRGSAQLRFSFSRGNEGWKISDIQPREFFTQF